MASECPKATVKMLNAKGLVEENETVQSWKWLEHYVREFTEYIDSSSHTGDWEIRVQYR